MAILDRLILRMAVCELLRDPATPPAGRHQRGARAGAHVQHRGVGEVHQRDAGRDPEEARCTSDVADACRHTTNRSSSAARTSTELAEARRRDLPAHVRPAAHDLASSSTRYGQRTHDELEAERVDDDHERPHPRDPRRSARRTSWCCPTAARRSRSTSARTRCRALDFQIFKLLDFGDWVGVEGQLFRTKTNELTIWASRLHFLAKCLLPLPEKWHGLTDVEIRYRQRYLDLIVNPDSRRVFETRSRVVAGDPRVHDRARLSRGRDADDAADRRRRASRGRSSRITTRSTWISTCASRRSCT